VTAALSPPASGVRTAGWPSAVGAPFDSPGGVLLITVSPAVASNRYSYPLTPNGHRLVQSGFALAIALLAEAEGSGR
jgi:hypothetical protein